LTGSRHPGPPPITGLSLFCSEVTLAAAKATGLVGRKRVLDSTPLYDAVATMDTVTLIRSSIRGVPWAAATDLDAELRR
jgi:hypothetical protein